MKKHTKRKYALLILEVQTLADEMGLAMVRAHVPYVAKTGRFTTHMQEVWEQYKSWAVRANEAGL